MRHQGRGAGSKLWLSITIVACATLAVAASYGTALQAKPSMATATHPPAVRDAYGHLPLSFEENRGQTDAQVKFLARGGGYSLFLTPTEAVLKLRSPSSAKKQVKSGAMPIAFHPESIEKPKFSVVRIRLEGANPNSTASGVDALPGHSNYFIGKDRAKWHTGIATYGGVRFESIYPGINLVYRGTQGRLEYDFVIVPQADPSRIKMNIDGADALSLDREGNLVIKTAGGEVIQQAPVIYQESHGTRHPVTGGYALMGKHAVRFKLGVYDRSAPLIIDPLLTYVSYLGGSGGDSGVGIAVDSNGAAIVTGTTMSTDFPVINAFQPNNFGEIDVFISKVSPDGTALVYSTYAGGSEDDTPVGIGVDAAGNAYVAGNTNSTDYPVSGGAYQTSFGTVFATALDPNGGLIYSTFLGLGATANGVTVDSSGDAFITGGDQTQSIPTTVNAAQVSCPNPGGGPRRPSAFCGFVTKFNPLGTSLVYSTYVGSGIEAQTIGVDGSGEAYIAGTLPQTYGGVGQSNCPVASCIYEAKLDSSGSNLLLSSGPGGDATRIVSTITVDSAGNSHVIGYNLNTNQFFLFNFNPNSGFSGVILSLGEFPQVSPQAIVADPSGNLLISGSVEGPYLTTTPGTFQSNFAGGITDGFFIELDPSGSFTLYSTYLGGSGGDLGQGLAVDSFGNAYVTGPTNSLDFPITSGVFQPSLGGPGGNAFVARIVPSPKLSPPPTGTATPSPTVTFTATPVQVSPSVTATPTPTTRRTPLPTRTPFPTSTAPTATKTPMPTIIMTPVQTAFPAITPTATLTATPTLTPTPTPTATPVGPVTYSPTSLSFPTRKVNTGSAVKFVTISNPKNNKAAVLITGVALQSQGRSGFNLNSLKTSCLAGHPVEAGKSCRVAVYFAPKAGGDATDLLLITGNMSNPGSIPLGGTGK